MFSHFGDILCQTMAWPWIPGYGSFKVIENGAVRYTTCDFLLDGHCIYSSILYHFRVIWGWIISWLEIWVRGQKRLLKLVPFKSLSMVSYSPSIVTMAISVAVCEIFSVKEWHDLESRVKVRSRSLEMAPFNRSHTSSYSPSIVTMAISCIAKFLYPTCI